MTTKYTTQGFVFKKQDRLEADRMFSVFTQDHGRIEVFAKAIRKIDAKLRGGIEVFSFCDIEFIHGRKRKTLTDAVFIKKYQAILKSPEKLEIAFLIANTLDKFVKGDQKDKEILQLLRAVFDVLENYPKEDKSEYLVYYYFVWNLIGILGYKPELAMCVVCAKTLNPHEIYFSNQEGGVMDAHCASIKKEIVKITQDVVKILRIIASQDHETLLKLKLEKRCIKLLQEVSESYGNYLFHSYYSKAV